MILTKIAEKRIIVVSPHAYYYQKVEKDLVIQNIPRDMLQNTKLLLIANNKKSRRMSGALLNKIRETKRNREKQIAVYLESSKYDTTSMQIMNLLRAVPDYSLFCASDSLLRDLGVYSNENIYLVTVSSNKFSITDRTTDWL